VKRVLLHVATGAAVIFLLAAPTPGHVGSCSDTTDAPADPEAFCTLERNWNCARLKYMSDASCGPLFTQMQYDDCRARIPTDCSGFRFAAGCVPTQRQTDTCISALSNMDNGCVAEAMLDQCRFCSGTAAPLVAPAESSDSEGVLDFPTEEDGDEP